MTRRRILIGVAVLLGVGALVWLVVAARARASSDGPSALDRAVRTEPLAGSRLTENQLELLMEPHG